MKTIIFLFTTAVVLSSCQATHKQAAIGREYSANFKPLTSTERQALDEVLGRSIEEITRSGDNIPERARPFTTLENYEWSSYDFRKLDVDKFMQNPVQENIMSSTVIPDNHVVLVGKSSDGKYLELDVWRGKENRWEISKSILINGAAQQNWINEVADRSDKGAFGILEIYSRQYYVFMIDGQPHYYSPAGIPQTAEGVSGYIVMVYENIKEAAGDINKIKIF